MLTFVYIFTYFVGYKWYKFYVFGDPSIYEACRPIIPCIILFAISLGWAVWSPTDVCGTDPRVFFFAMGTVFSNIAVGSEQFLLLIHVYTLIS
ncbi:hypothetical protein ANCDUO_15171 [Ancylostoma duodenale]|uniref:Uncharacterized protein n=1 Tax=Ancylostoma duodenale TaxID=51022 RepID=A0A0C2GCE2_9BILA|nr:hypothetical protein ANCDUO_15171 [Ancylostoma duodenale]